MSVEPFEQVVVRHGPAVWRVCRAMVGPIDADDAWSETFLSALRAYPELPPGSNVAAWLVTIAQRKCIDGLRRTRRAALPSECLREEVATMDGTAERADTAELHDALSRLAPKQRAAVVYHHLGGLPYAQVGGLIGTSEAAARRNAADGVAALRRIYASEGTP